EWWSLDAKNIELRIPAYEAGEEEMIAIFEKQDEPPYYGSYHLLIFDILHPEKWDRNDPEGLLKAKKEYSSTWYQWTKNGNFAVQYGAVASSGTADRAYHVDGAQLVVEKRFGKIKELNERMIAYAKEFGYVETIPDKTVDPNRGYPIECSRNRWGSIKPTIPLNYHIQSTAMWWMMKAMLRCQEYLDDLNSRKGSLGYYMILQVHDELVFDFPKGKAYKANMPKIRRIRRLMEEGGRDLGIPTPVGIEYHEKTWDKGIAL
ncbi:MAG: DNA polymerase, partial [Nitrosopumilus sp.]